jgi:hypothetical protein
MFFRQSYRCAIVWKNTKCIVEFSLQQWLREHTTMLCYLHMVYLISLLFRMVIMIRGYRSECTIQF